jgi:hypothetical protein
MITQLKFKKKAKHNDLSVKYLVSGAGGEKASTAALVGANDTAFCVWATGCHRQHHPPLPGHRRLIAITSGPKQPQCRTVAWVGAA